jgi:hypothetical protein
MLGSSAGSIDPNCRFTPKSHLPDALRFAMPMSHWRGFWSTSPYLPSAAPKPRAPCSCQAVEGAAYVAEARLGALGATAVAVACGPAGGDPAAALSSARATVARPNASERAILAREGFIWDPFNRATPA